MGTLTQPVILDQKGTVSMPSSRSASRLSVTFDDDHAVTEAGLALVAGLSEKLGLEALADELVDVAPSRSPGRGGNQRRVIVSVSLIGEWRGPNNGHTRQSHEDVGKAAFLCRHPAPYAVFLIRLQRHAFCATQDSPIFLAARISSGAGPSSQRERTNLGGRTDTPRFTGLSVVSTEDSVVLNVFL
jgi:hypothetical protein